MRLHRSGMIAIAVAAAAAGGCGGKAEDQRTSDGDAGDIEAEVISFDTVAQPEINLPPDFGDSCSGNEDCTTGFCVEGVSGFVCTKTCVEECPAGWGCKGVQSGSADIVFVCVQDGTPEPDTIGGDTVTQDTQPPSDTQVATDTGPSDTGDTGPGDTTADTDVGPPLGNACEAAPGPGSDELRAEASMGGGDFPDCLIGCAFEANPTIWRVDLRSEPYTGVIGAFDGDEHVYTFEDADGPGPDIDIIPIYAAPRTMLEFAVLKDSSAGLVEPLIYVSDGFQVRTFNSDVSGSNTCARTTFAFPYVTELPLYVVIEEATNYDLWSPTGYGGGTVGGAGYGWIVRIRKAAFAPSEIGDMTVGASRTLPNEALSVGGETRYYRFYAPGTSQPTVSLTRKSGAEFAPSIAGMKSLAGELVWQRVEDDGDGDGEVTLASNGFRACIPASECPPGFPCPPDLCTEGDTEFVFAIFDFNGAAGPGLFSYDLTVRID